MSLENLTEKQLRELMREPLVPHVADALSVCTPPWPNPLTNKTGVDNIAQRIVPSGVKGGEVISPTRPQADVGDYVYLHMQITACIADTPIGCKAFADMLARGTKAFCECKYIRQGDIVSVYFALPEPDLAIRVVCTPSFDKVDVNYRFAPDAGADNWEEVTSEYFDA